MRISGRACLFNEVLTSLKAVISDGKPETEEIYMDIGENVLRNVASQ